MSAAEVFAGSFLLVIVSGTFAFKSLPGLYIAEELSWTDAVFTATSATCVTGLIVVDTATYFTFRGQLLILVLIQLGGLGMLTLASMIISALGGRISLRTETVAASGQTALPHIPPRSLILDVVRFTFVIEAAGALVLYAIWAPALGWRNAVWPAVFHSVSAFCNAGFSTYSDSLMGFGKSPLTILCISVLVIAGGMGFIVIEEISQRVKKRNVVRRLSTHSKLVLAMTAILTLAGWGLFAAFEWERTLREYSPVDKVSNALFMSVTARTAGFNTVDYADASNSSNFLTILLMTIGGSPGSTAGGLKTTTVAILLLLAWSRLRGEASTAFLGRSIPEETIQRALGVFILSTATIFLGIFFLSTISDFLSRDHDFLVGTFEVASAFNTVGLSMGLTPSLSSGSRWVIIIFMFAGRIGPLSLAAVLRERFVRRGKYRYAYEDVMVG